MRTGSSEGGKATIPRCGPSSLQSRLQFDKAETVPRRVSKCMITRRDPFFDSFAPVSPVTDARRHPARSPGLEPRSADDTAQSPHARPAPDSCVSDGWTGSAATRGGQQSHFGKDQIAGPHRLAERVIKVPFCRRQQVPLLLVRQRSGRDRLALLLPAHPSKSIASRGGLEVPIDKIPYQRPANDSRKD